MTKHTPGPWEALENLGNRGRVVARGKFVADMYANDARLIAAAPDMLAALKHVQELYADVEIVRAAIAKAEDK